MLKKTFGEIVVKSLKKKDKMKVRHCIHCVFFYKNQWGINFCLHKRNIKVIHTWLTSKNSFKKLPSFINKNNDCLRFRRNIIFLRFLYFIFVLSKRLDTQNS